MSTPEVLVSAIRERLDEIELAANDATPGSWVAEPCSRSLPGEKPWPADYVSRGPMRERFDAGSAFDAAHIALHDPSSVLRRVQADRRVLQRHRPIRDLEDTETICARCSGASFDLGVLVGHYSPVTRWPCGDFRDLADGLGIDLPEDTGGDGRHAMAESIYRYLRDGYNPADPDPDEIMERCFAERSAETMRRARERIARLTND